ncbi:MAG: PD40 domain-containing protein, partial [Acidobacteria bacterium]|nr:PD40 domain-containing protein [Acidobacteriota bacterium]
MIRTLLLIAALCAAAWPAAASAEGTPTKLLRFPDIHGDTVIFVYAGDLWTAPVAGGLARRLTAHPGLEQSPKFSPDGRWIAFNGQYDGDEQVYVIPAEGGEPRQLTFYPARGPLAPRWGFDNQVYGWTPDGKSVVVRSLRDSWDLGDSKIFEVPVDGGLPTALPMPEAGGTDLSPDGKQVVYSPLARDFRTWKRYQGGWAQELYIFDLSSHALRRVTDNPRADRDPMWIGDTIVFNSDRSGTFNLYAFDVAQGTTRELTSYDLWDVRWPSSDSASRIVYELDGELHVFDLPTGADRKLSIEVPDDGLGRRPSRVSAAGNIESFELSPGGERALFSARGDIFTVPAEHGSTRNLTRSSGAHDKWPTWSPDGKQIAFLSDRDGEEEIYLVDQAGGDLRQVTKGGHAMRYQPRWSPDGKRLAFSDKDAKLYVVQVADGKITEIARNPQGQLNDYAWSPHGGFLAFTSNSEAGTGSVFVWSVADGEVRQVTDEQYNDYSPTWSPDGSYLFYLSDRALAPQLGFWEWNYVVNRETEVFALALRPDVPSPVAPQSDEVGGGDTDKKADQGSDDATASPQKKNKGKTKADGKDDAAKDMKPISITFDGLADRVVKLPIEGGNYGFLTALDGKVLYLDRSAFFYGRASERQPILRAFSFEDREQSTVAEGVSQGFEVSRDGKKVMVGKGGSFELMNLDGSDSKSISTAGLEVDRVPTEEWAQIFDEVWRRYRDFFYVETMHGYDWKAIGDRYRALLPYVAHRSDLNYILGEMVAELNIGHAYIAGGDYEIPDRPKVALLGAELELDQATGRYRIAHILPGDNHEERYRSPLTEVGVDVHEGDYLLAIDGEALGA